MLKLDDFDMAFVPAFYRNCVGFIYADKTDAQKDEGCIAVGFVVSVSGTIHHLVTSHYFVTCAHVVRDVQTSVAVRFNTYNSCQSIRIPKRDFVIKEKLDLAIASLKLPRGFPIVHIQREAFVGMNDLHQREIGAGDEVFMVSRLMRENVRYTHRNLCVFRFGNISLVPEHEELFYLVEMRSVAGHSGSPVLVYPTPNVFGQQRTQDADFAPMLLGINRGHLQSYDELVMVENPRIKHPKYVVAGNMAISVVVPAWYIVQALDDKRFLRKRIKADNAIPSPVVDDGQTTPSASSKSEPEP
jgi:hypothetical protein